MSVPLFLIPVLAGLTAQFLKSFTGREMYRRMREEGEPLPHYGGMPSAHTAFAVSLATTVGLADGMMSASFAIAACIAIFIIDEALRMRIFVGRHGRALQQLIECLPEEEQKKYPKLQIRLGHKPPEVIVGALLGFLITLAVFFFLGP